jgi:hypothetical protein
MKDEIYREPLESGSPLHVYIWNEHDLVQMQWVYCVEWSNAGPPKIWITSYTCFQRQTLSAEFERVEDLPFDIPMSEGLLYRLAEHAGKELYSRAVVVGSMKTVPQNFLGTYHYIGTGVATDAQERSRVQVLELEATLGRMLADDDFAPVHEFLKEAVKSVGYWRDEFLQTAARLGRDSFRPALKEAMPLWNACAAEYGRGYGFRDRVAAHFQHWFDDPAQSGVLELVETALAEQWSSCFAANVEKLVASLRPAREEVGAHGGNDGQ